MITPRQAIQATARELALRAVAGLTYTPQARRPAVLRAMLVPVSPALAQDVASSLAGGLPLTAALQRGYEKFLLSQAGGAALGDEGAAGGGSAGVAVLDWESGGEAAYPSAPSAPSGGWAPNPFPETPSTPSGGAAPSASGPSVGSVLDQITGFLNQVPAVATAVGAAAQAINQATGGSAPASTATSTRTPIVLDAARLQAATRQYRIVTPAVAATGGATQAPGGSAWLWGLGALGLAGGAFLLLRKGRKRGK